MKHRTLKIISLCIFIFSWMTVFTLFTYASKAFDMATIEMLAEVDDEAHAYQLASQHGIHLLNVSSFGIALYEVPLDISSDLKNKGFEYNQILEVIRPPWQTPSTKSDPLIDNQYALDLMEVHQAWTNTMGSEDITIAIIDTGIDITHEEFVGRIHPNSYNARTEQVWVQGDAIYGQVIQDDNGHGTSVAGVIGAIHNNQKGIAGIVQNSPLLIIKANKLDNPSTTDVDESRQFEDQHIIEAIYYAIDQGADVINLSLGSSSTNLLMRNAIQKAHAEGIIVVGAAGNDGNQTKMYPASYEGVISVSAIDQNQVIASYSNFNDAIDVTAPGTSILTTGLNNTYVYTSGTSLAAPQVTGVIGLMLAYFPERTRIEIINQLIASTKDLGTTGYDIYYGHGLVIASKALMVETITINFDVNGGIYLPPIEVISNIPFMVDVPEKEGHTFFGWYLDQAYTIPFEVGVDTTSEDTTLFAKFEINFYDVTFITSGSDVASISVMYNDTFEQPVTNQPGYHFEGWYLDADFNEPYLGQPVTNHLILYALFAIKSYSVRFYHQNGLLDEQDVIHGESINPWTPESPYPFLGWYYEVELITKYESQPIFEDLVLYARFDDGLYQVVFYDYDLETKLFIDYVFYGSSVEPIDHPLRPNSQSFSYAFIGWSVDFDVIVEDTSIYPLYEKTYIPNQIRLNKGIDTIDDIEDWIDAGLMLNEEDITIEKQIELYDEAFQSFLVSYHLIYDHEIVETIYRMIHVIPSIQITIELNPTITTIEKNGVFTDLGATSNVGEIVVTGEVDTRTTGTYIITYTVIYQDVTKSKSKYVYVLEKTEIFQVNNVMWYEKEREYVI